MQLSPIMSANNKPSFQAKLTINDEDNVLLKYQKQELHDMASKIGTDEDTIEINFGKYIEGKEHTWAEQGEWFTASDEDFVSVDVDSKIGNKEKSTQIFGSGYPSSICDEIFGRITEHFNKLIDNPVEVDMTDFWAKNDKAQERYDRKHHLGRFSKD